VANALKEVVSASFNNNLGNVHREATGHYLIVTLADEQAETFSDIPSNVEAETLVHTQTDTVGEAK